jgi:hypothetical protein
MSQRVAIKLFLVLLAVGFIVLAPVVPIQVVLKDDLPEIEADESLSSNEVDQIVRHARGGNFVNLVEIAKGTVNAPFTHVSLIRSDNVPYEGSIEDRSDVIVSYGTCAPSAIIAHCAGYKVYLRRTSSGWKVVEKSDWIT